MLEAALVRGLTEGGIDVVQIGMGPSPMLYFATHYLDVDGGIQVTGSHNPADYNGFKMLLKGRSVFGAEIQALGRRAAVGRLDARARARSRKSTSARPMSTGCCRTSRAGRSASAGTPAMAPRARCSTCWSSGCRASITSIFTEVDGTLPQPPSRPDGRSQSRRPEGAGRRRSSSTSASPSTATATASARSTARAA